MSETEKRIPGWVFSARNAVEKAKQHWERVRLEGQADIRRGLEISKGAARRLEELNYLEQTLGQDLHADMWNDEVVSVTGTYLAGTISYHEQASSRIAGLYTSFGQYKQEKHEYLISAISDTALTSGSAIYMNAGIERRFEAITPNYKPVLEAVQPEQIGSRQQVLDELGILLRPFGPKYLHMLRGSEEALRKESLDHLSQAAHSMRDLFQQLIEHLAPTVAVKLQPWFESTHGAPGGVSRMSRLRYILYGAGETLDEEVVEQLDEAAKRARDALDLAIARAHDHDPQLTKPEVQLAVDHARFSLLEVLKRYKARREQKSL
jgi:hypothetical protein